jgi:AAA domain
VPNTARTPGQLHLREFGRRVCSYFRTFLETDFKRHQAPRRRIQLKNDAGFRTAFPLRKYTALFNAAWALASRKPSEGLELRVAPRQYTATVSPMLRALIKEHVDAIPSTRFEGIRDQTAREAATKAPRAGDNVETYVEGVQIAFAELVASDLVAPLLSVLEGVFKQQAYSAVESIFEIETDLVDSISQPVVEHLTTALVQYVVKRDIKPTEQVLNDFFSEAASRERLVEFFAEFATADAFSELRDLMQYISTGNELQLYLYLGDLRFATHSYPLFYFPLQARFDEQAKQYVLTIDPPHLYISKRALDFVQQELAGEASRNSVSPIQERIVYLDSADAALPRMDDVMARLIPTYGLPGPLQMAPAGMRKVETSQLRLSTAAYLAVFDKADESLINDFEALLAALDGDAAGVEALFHDMVEGIVLGEPRNIEAQVESDWNALSVADRLVAVAPIPVSEEQPGTGKSHTITAIAFDCIIRGKSCLILSDKKEALEVVQDKLEQTLADVRYADGDDFPNPILRLGKGSQSNYPKLIQQQARQKIERHLQAHNAHADEVRRELEFTRDDLKSKINTTITSLSGVALARLAELHRMEAKVEDALPGLSKSVATRATSENVAGLKTALQALTPEVLIEAERALETVPAGVDVPTLENLLRVHLAAREALQSGLTKRAEVVELFPALNPEDAQDFVALVTKYEQLRMPVFGYLFRNAAVMELNASVGVEYKCLNALDLHRRLDDLKAVAPLLGKVQIAMTNQHVGARFGRIVYDLVARERVAPPAADALHRFLLAILAVLEAQPRAALKVGGKVGDWRAFMALLVTIARFANEWADVQGTLGGAPVVDYVGQKSRLQSLYTSTMANVLDQRFLGFVRENGATAKTLGTVIKKSAKFPSDAFDKLKTAMPCIIASIREFAEYVPLQKDVFDVVIIDEGSQVSVAQAFPALLRARKVVVFGDPKQFSNVKSMQASLVTNAGYLKDIREHFVQNISSASDRIARLEMFDVKKSILEFMDLIKSFGIMLRKHFRSYPELISFSSKHFYSGQLQAIKVRGKPIDEVIKFSFVDQGQDVGETAGAAGGKRARNTNAAEAEFIRQELRRIIDDDEQDPTVGIITPHTEQQAYLTRLLFNDDYGDRFASELRLKIMTFDSCQGEERELIFYSMVATSTDDKLNYIFPVEISAAETQVEEMLKMQRLNVGFSRAQEAIQFVLSKPIEQYRGSARKVLQHYWSILHDASRADPESTDPKSPMERKVLTWLEQTPIFQTQRERFEVIPQFAIGDYLRQLDPAYQHPAYRCDFLLRYAGANAVVQVVLEYDGLKEHFDRLENVNPGNYEAYYRQSDLERQFVLESYGYRFIRLNRFNLGVDPVASINSRLTTLLGSAVKPFAAQSVERVREQAENLENGDAKTCTRCERVLPMNDFFDPGLGGGKGGTGRICIHCKGRHQKSMRVSSRRSGRWR